MRTVDERISRLERQNRWLGAAAALGLLAGGWGLGVGLRRERAVPDEVRARRLVLVDGRGVTRAELGLTAAGDSGLLVADAQGRSRGLFGVGRDGSPRLSMATRTGQSLVELTAYADEAPRLSLWNVEGAEIFHVGLEADGTASLGLADATGKPRADLSVTETGKPKLVLEGRDGTLFQAPMPD